ncbi:MAG: RNA-directed DNA polymerase [Rhodospirillaceae bacterium]|nr:RNA-directed DNA polymerase [Rhodospirillaceae bacterium]
MRLPQPQLESIGFLFEAPSELIQAMGNECSPDEADEIRRLYGLGLPPVTSQESLSVIFGYNPGFIWSLLNRTPRHYRHFEIPKGAGHRQIEAPRVALKAIQKWLSHHLQRAWTPNENVFGFVPGRSHIDAAAKHLSSEWVFSVDLENFFPSVSIRRVKEALRTVGYQTDKSVEILSTLCCLDNHLVQGSPTSPVLSNIVLKNVDQQFASIAAEKKIVFTRYADDIVFSGSGDIPHQTLTQIKSVVSDDGWTLSERKERLSETPNRLKVHGLLVHGRKLRLTKGYRNRIRAYRHLLKNEKIKEEDLSKIKGHLNYASQVE